MSSDKFRKDQLYQQLARVGKTRTLKAGALEQILQRLRVLERALRLDARRDYFRAPGRKDAEAAIQTAMKAVKARAPSKPAERRQRAVGN